MENRKWHCSMLKTNAKAKLKKYYWWAVLVCLIITFVSGGFSGVFNFGRVNVNYSSIASENTKKTTISTPYELGYVEGYKYGYESCQNGYQYSEDALKQQTNSDTEEYTNGLVNGYHAGYYDCFNGNEFDSDPPSVKEANKDFSYDDKLSFKENAINLANSMGISERELNVILTVASVVFLLVSLLMAFFTIFVTEPLSIGATRFFMCARNGDVQFGNIGYAFKKGQYIKVVKTTVVKSLYTFFWSLLFIIPGIVKTFSYALVPYILSENPTISTKKAITISRKTMKGEKWHFFILGLSFILWYVLGAIACGIGTIFVLPYVQATYAEFYALMRQKALAFGYADAEDLPGYPEKTLENNIPPYNSGMSFGNPIPNNNVNNDFNNSDYTNSENGQ